MSDTNSWESMLTKDLAEEILGRALTDAQWVEITDKLDDVVFETVDSFRE